MRYGTIVCITLAMLVSACASITTAHLDEVPTPDDGRVTVTDLRTAKQKEHRRDSTFSAIVFLGDDEVKPSAVLLLRSALQKQTQVGGKLSLEISEFRVIDYFPVRLRAGGQGLIGQAIMDALADSKTDSAFIEHLAVPESENSIICVVAGKLNGSPVKTAMFRTYKESAFAVSVRNDPSFKKAVVGSVEACAEDLVSQMTQSGVPAAGS